MPHGNPWGMFFRNKRAREVRARREALKADVTQMGGIAVQNAGTEATQGFGIAYQNAGQKAINSVGLAFQKVPGKVFRPFAVFSTLEAE